MEQSPKKMMTMMILTWMVAMVLSPTLVEAAGTFAECKNNCNHAIFCEWGCYALHPFDHGSGSDSGSAAGSTSGSASGSAGGGFLGRSFIPTSPAPSQTDNGQH